AFGWVGYQLFMTGYNAKTEPHALEVFIAQRILHLAIPIEARNVLNPIPLRPDLIKESLAPIGKNVNPRVPDLRFTAMPTRGEGDPAEDKESWKLVHFIRHLPQLTPEELDQMQTLTPKTKNDLEEESAFSQFLQGDDAAAARTDSGHNH
ncbi:MAG: hypothetical protein ABI604_14535, partial [Nitrospirota bacterium]